MPLFDDSLFWSITSPAGVQSTVFGTVHVLDSNHIVLPIDRLEAELDRLGRLAMEVSPEDLEGKQPQDLAASDLEPITPEELERVMPIVEQSPRLRDMADVIASMPRETVTSLMQMETQLSSPLFETLDFEPERHFATLATERDLPIVGLEAFDDQVAHINANDDLEAAIAAVEQPPFDMFARYGAQDLRLLDKNDQFSDAMAARNTRLAAGVTQHLSDAPALVLIGAAHLPFDNGVLALLQEQGWAIERLEQPVTVR